MGDCSPAFDRSWWNAHQPDAVIAVKSGDPRPDALQIFAKNANQWRGRDLPREEIRQFRAKVKAAGIWPVVSHASYLINLAATNPDFRDKSIRALSEELQRADQLGLPFLVLHPGAHMGDGEETGLARIVSNLDAVLASRPGSNCRIALEITAGQGTSLGHTFEQLATIIDRSKSPERLATCLDTAHLFAAGFDIATAKGFWDMVHKFDRIIGRERLAAWHLNDSKTALGSRVDRHDHIGKGKIGLAPFCEIMRSREFAAIPKVLETPKKKDLKEDVVNLGVLMEMIQ